MAQLHFANLCPGANKSKLLSIVGDDHEFAPTETMQSHIKSGKSPESWGYYFSLVIITDKTKSELDYLMKKEEVEVSEDVFEVYDKYEFLEPVKDTPEYNAMRSTGQIEITFEQFKPYFKEAQWLTT